MSLETAGTSEAAGTGWSILDAGYPLPWSEFRRFTPVALRRFLKAIRIEPLRRVDTPNRSLYSDDIAGFLAADV
jgi:hypothetical protein